MINQGLARDLVLVSAFVTTSTLTCPQIVSSITLIVGNLVGITSSDTNTHLGVAQVTSITAGVCTLTPRRTGQGWNTIVEAYTTGTERFVFNNQTNSAGVLISVQVVSNSVVASGGISSQIIQVGASYPTPTLSQLANSLDFIGSNYPAALRLGTDRWEQTVAPVTQTTVTDIVANGLRINWNIPTFVNYLGVTTNADNYGFFWQISISPTFATILQSGSTANLTQVVAGLSPLTTYYTRVMHGTLSDAQIAFSNQITTTTMAIVSIYETAVSLLPQHAYTFIPISVTATSVPNNGTAITAMTKSGTVGHFTKNVGLISNNGGARLFFAPPATVQTGHSSQGGVDWVSLICLVAGATNGNINYTMYENLARNSNRIRLGTTGFVNQPSFGISPKTGTAITSMMTGAAAGQRVIMVTKINNVIRIYNKGSITPTNSYTMIADQVMFTNVLTWFEDSQGTPASTVGVEAVYNVFAHGASIASQEQAWINLMLLNID